MSRNFKKSLLSGVRNEVKGAGILDTRENCWKFFIDRVRRQLRVVLCFSPVGSTLRVRSRKFPAIINCTAINWFHEWPQEALMSVSKRFLQELNELPEIYRQVLSHLVIIPDCKFDFFSTLGNPRLNLWRMLTRVLTLLVVCIWLVNVGTITRPRNLSWNK